MILDESIVQFGKSLSTTYQSSGEGRIQDPLPREFDVTGTGGR